MSALGPQLEPVIEQVHRRLGLGALSAQRDDPDGLGGEGRRRLGRQVQADAPWSRLHRAAAAAP